MFQHVAETARVARRMVQANVMRDSVMTDTCWLLIKAAKVSHICYAIMESICCSQERASQGQPLPMFRWSAPNADGFSCV